MVAEDNGVAGAAASEAVCVAVHIRPLIEQELEQGCAECLAVTPGMPQVSYRVLQAAQGRPQRRSGTFTVWAGGGRRSRKTLSLPPLLTPPPHPSCPPLQIGSGPHSFTYDSVFGGDCGQEPAQLYHRTVAPLVDGLFKGYNATVSSRTQCAGSVVQQ